MKRVLFVSNGNGESAIAERIARELGGRARTPLGLDHLALVGVPQRGALTPVGPRRAMPSGGLVAMGNLRAFAADVRAGFFGLLRDQVRFLRREGARYDVLVAVGDTYAFALAAYAVRAVCKPIVFVGTAKSVVCAPYGRAERAILRQAARLFVRDRATAEALRAHGLHAEAPGNAIADLLDGDGATLPFGLRGGTIALLPGSRPNAYGDAVRAARLLPRLAERCGPVEAVLSVAPSLDAGAFEAALARDGWAVSADPAPFAARRGAATVYAWGGSLGPLLRAAAIVLGQAGTANEQAAAAGVPVVALDDEFTGRPLAHESWYRMRQRKLLGDALALVPPEPGAGADALAALLGDGERMARMRAAGRERIGPPGGARAIAAAVAEAAGA